MDTQFLVKKLNSVFCNGNKTAGKKYIEAWLSEVDFGGIYNDDVYILCVKAGHEMGDYASELKDIFNRLDKEAHNELKYIWSVRVYNADNQIHCEREDIQVLTSANAC